MAVKKDTGPRDINEALLQLSEDLNRQAVTPNIFGYKPHFKQVKYHTTGKFSPDKTYEPIKVSEIEAEKSISKADLIKIRLYIGGNRSGKTVGGIIEDIWWVTKTHPFIDVEQIWPEPIRGRICSVDFINGHEKIIIPEILRWCPRSYFRGGSWLSAYDRDTHTIYFANGGSIELMSNDQALDKFAGTSRHFIHFDEEPPEDIYKECMARLIDTGGCAWFTMTPVEGMTWIYDTIYEPGISQGSNEIEGQLMTILVVEVDMFDNPFVADEEKEIYITLLDKNDIQARVHGKFVRRGGLIYVDFDEKLHIIEPSTPSRDYLWVASLDHGFRNPTAWLWHAVNFEGRVITFREHYASGLVIAEHAKIVRAINSEHGKEPDYYVGDPSIKNSNPVSGTSVLEEYVKFSIPIILGNNDVQAGIIRTARYLKSQPDEHGNSVPFWLITENCTNTIWEIKRYRWASWAHKRTEQDHNVKEEPVKKDDHAMDSCRYFFMSRPDLRAEQIGTSKPDYSQIMGQVSTAISPWENTTKRDWDSDSNKASQWNKEYAGRQSNWESEEYLGSEW